MKSASKIISFTLFLIFSNFVSSFAHIPLEEIWVQKHEQSSTGYIICHPSIIIDGKNPPTDGRAEVFLISDTGKEVIKKTFKDLIIISKRFTKPDAIPFIKKAQEAFNQDAIENIVEITLLLLNAFSWYKPYLENTDTSQFDKSLNKVLQYYITLLIELCHKLPAQQYFIKNIVAIQKEIDEAIPCITIPVIKSEIEKLQEQRSLDLVNMDQTYSFFIFQELDGLIIGHSTSVEYLSQKEIQSATSTMELVSAYQKKINHEIEGNGKGRSWLWTWKKHKNFYEKLTTNMYANFNEIVEIENVIEFDEACNDNCLIVDQTLQLFINFTNSVEILKDQFITQPREIASDSSTSLIGSFIEKITSLFSYDEED